MNVVGKLKTNNILFLSCTSILTTCISIKILPTSNTVRLILKFIWSSLITNSWNSPSWMKALACTHLESSTVTLNPMELANTVAVYKNRIQYSAFINCFFHFVLFYEVHANNWKKMYYTSYIWLMLWKYGKKKIGTITCDCDIYHPPPHTHILLLQPSISNNIKIQCYNMCYSVPKSLGWKFKIWKYIMAIFR